MGKKSKVARQYKERKAEREQFNKPLGSDETLPTTTTARAASAAAAGGRGQLSSVVCPHGDWIKPTVSQQNKIQMAQEWT